MRYQDWGATQKRIFDCVMGAMGQEAPRQQEAIIMVLWNGIDATTAAAALCMSANNLSMALLRGEAYLKKWAGPWVFA